MHTLPDLDIEDVPMSLDALGRVQFCRMQNEAVLANFALGIEAESTDEWEITSIHIGTQALQQGTDLYRRLAQHLEAERISSIHQHIIEHLSGAREQAAYDAHEHRMQG